MDYKNLLLLIFITTFLMSCATSYSNWDYVVRINRDGHIINTRHNHSNSPNKMAKCEVEEKFEKIFLNAESLADTKKSKKVKLLIYVHGGLNDYSDTDERIKDGIPSKIMKSETDWHYPVFISWPSNGIKTWSENTFRIREGKKTSVWFGIVTSPFILASDILTSIGNFSSTVYYQAANEKDRVASTRWLPNSFLSRSWKDSIAQICVLDSKYCDFSKPHNREIRIKANLSTYYTTKTERSLGAFYQTLTLPIRYTIGSIYHSAISRSAWDNMKRRTRNMFYPPDCFDSRWDNGVPGGYFFESVLKRANEVKNDPNNELEYEITLIGHSMGTIILNNALSAYKNQWAESGALKNIVYMAAACSINDAISSLAPLLVPPGEDGTNYQPINFYNLTLNRVAEVAEVHGYGCVPTGSLLVSIDQHFEIPFHPFERTLGSEVNVLSCLNVIDEILGDSRGDVVFKVFDRRKKYYPAKHGDFGLIPFWESSTWKINDGSKYAGAPFPKN